MAAHADSHPSTRHSSPGVNICFFSKSRISARSFSCAGGSGGAAGAGAASSFFFALFMALITMNNAKATMTNLIVASTTLP